MATVTEKRTCQFGPRAAGIRMTPREFDRADFVEGWNYELINGVLIVTPAALINERDPNDMLGYWLRVYQNSHPEGKALDCTTYEHTVRCGNNRRRADRVIWAGLGRLPRIYETPTIIIEFVSSGKRSWKRDYEEKRDEYLAIAVGEYWVIDRFEQTLTVFRKQGGRVRKLVVPKKQNYTTDLLPGFVLPLAELLTLAERWPEPEPDEE